MSESAKTSRETILMIDDEEDARKLVKLLLERAGYRVLTAQTGAEGLILAKVERPQVILLDILMPKMKGHEALRRLKGDLDTRDIPVIMLTAMGTEHDIAASFRLGAVFHLEKPFETRDLLEKVKAACLLGRQNASNAVNRPIDPDE